MKREVITLYRPEEIRTLTPGGYKLNAHGRWAPLHKFLWKMLQRMGALGSHMDETFTYVRVLIRDEEIIKRIHSTLDAIHRRGDTPKEVLMGPDTFADLMSSPAARDWPSPFSFTTSYEYNTSMHRTMFGLPVHVLPQMEGVLVR